MTKTVLAALALGAVAGVASAQEATGGIRPPRVAVIDLAKVSADSQLGKSYAQKIEGLRNAFNAETKKKEGELQKLDEQLKTLQEELEKQASVLSPEALDRKRQDITRKTRERQAFFEDGQAELQRKKDQAEAQADSLNNEFQQAIKPHIDAVAKEKGIDIILTSQVALTVNQDYDISKAVIAKADAAPIPAAAKPTSGAAAPGAAAAKPPAPKPAATPAVAPAKPGASPSPNP
jgi:outer membrane protein